MKKMRCNQLGGACDVIFEAISFEEIAELSKKHAMEMYQNGCQEHIAAMGKMQEMMQTPGAVEQWMKEKMELFDNL